MMTSPSAAAAPGVIIIFPKSMRLPAVFVSIRPVTPRVLYDLLVRLWGVSRNMTGHTNNPIITDACCDVVHELIELGSSVPGTTALLGYMLRDVISVKLHTITHIKQNTRMTLDYGSHYWVPGKPCGGGRGAKRKHTNEQPQQRARKCCKIRVDQDSTKGKVLCAAETIRKGHTVDYMASCMTPRCVKTSAQYHSGGEDGMYAIELGGSTRRGVVLDPRVSDVGAGAMAEDYREVQVDAGGSVVAVMNRAGKKANCELSVVVSHAALYALFHDQCGQQ